MDACQCLRQTGLMTTTLPAPVPPTAGPQADSPAERAVACCAPLVREPLSVEGAAALAGVLKALADPMRLRLLSMIAAHEGGEACVCDLTEPLGLSQPTVSHHLRVLLDAGLVSRDKRGVWAYFRLVPGALTGLAALLTDSAAAPAVDGRS